MLKWIKKDPFIHLLILFLTPLFIVAVITAGLIIYGVFTLFDPNYVEFGPAITFYKSKDCAKPELVAYGDCMVYLRSISMYKNNPPTLYKGIKRIISEVNMNYKSSNFSFSDPSQLSCSVDGRIIDNIREKVQDKKTYKCWPKIVNP